MKVLAGLVFCFTLGATSFYSWDENSLKAEYSEVKKSGFPKDLGEVGSIRSHHTPFLWKVLSDNKLRDAWPMAMVLLGKVGTEKDFHQLLIQHFRLYRKIEDPNDTWEERKAFAWALIYFSDRGLGKASEMLLGGVWPDYWKRFLVANDDKHGAVREDLSYHMVNVLWAVKKMPKAEVLLRDLAGNSSYIHQGVAKDSLKEYTERFK